MGLRQSAPIKSQINARLNTQERQYSRNVCLNDFRFIKQLEQNQTHSYIQNWMVEFEQTKKLMILKEIPKLDVYNDRQVDDQINQLQLMVKFPNPLIVKPLYAFQDLENLYFVVEYVSGGDLAQCMKSHIFTENESRFLICMILIALQHLHNQKLIYTALKPSQILIDEKGYPKIHGLNFVRKIDEYELGPIEAVISVYLAPEVLLRQKIGPEADFYSIGMILFELMTGRKPFETEISRKSLIENVINKQIQVKKSELPEGWSLDAADFINKLIQNNPLNRLGYYGIFELKKHNWLAGMPWQKLEEKLIFASYVPKITKVQKNSKVQSDIKKKKKVKVQQNYFKIYQSSNVLLNNQDFQNMFCLYNYRYDQEINDIENITLTKH